MQTTTGCRNGSFQRARELMADRRMHASTGTVPPALRGGGEAVY